MTKWRSVLAVLGVVYLLTVSCLFFILGHRYDMFQRHGDTVQGTVVGFRHAPSVGSGPLHLVSQPSGDRLAVIEYQRDGRTRTVTSNPYTRASSYTLGQKVTLVLDRSQDSDINSEVVAVKDHNQTRLKMMPYVFLAVALGLAWYLGISHPGILRRRRARAALPGGTAPGTP